MRIFLSNPKSGVNLVFDAEFAAAIAKAAGTANPEFVRIALQTYDASKRRLTFHFAGPNDTFNADLRYMQTYKHVVEGQMRTQFRDVDFYPQHGQVTLDSSKHELRPKEHTLTLLLPALEKMPPATTRVRGAKPEAPTTNTSTVVVTIAGLKQQAFKVPDAKAFELCLDLTRQGYAS
jgi:hypothetical protein